MARDMKMMIADAAKELLLKDNVKKLTVRDIVDKCHITRQTFYYHFNDVPHLLQWILEQGIENIKAASLGYENDEEEFKYFFLVALNLKDTIIRVMQMNYKDEITVLLREQFDKILKILVEEKDFYKKLSPQELEIIIRYHAQAIIGVLMNWSAEDEASKDQIIHIIFQIITGEISPY